MTSPTVIRNKWGVNVYYVNDNNQLISFCVDDRQYPWKIFDKDVAQKNPVIVQFG